MATLSNLERPTMRFSRHRHSYGIVIYAEFEDTYGVSRWHPVRNFGEFNKIKKKHEQQT